jgi:prepilin signal peptidase PulO-like enzyme (type II secretory pathway)
MKGKNILISVGIVIYIVLSGIDRFVYHIPNIIYIPAAILGIALILTGFFKDKSK